MIENRAGPSRNRHAVERSLRDLGLAEAHYNRRGKALRLAHDIYSAPCKAFYHAPTGEALNSYVLAAGTEK